MKYASRILSAAGLLLLTAAMFLKAPTWVGILGLVLGGLAILLPERWSR